MSGDKTEEPTEHKLREARKKGQLAKSQDMIGLVELPEKVEIVTGNNSSDEAKIAGITPAGFTLTGRSDLPPSSIFMPTWRRGY